MLRMSNHIHGITHVVFGVIDVCWLVKALYQNTDIDELVKKPDLMITAIDKNYYEYLDKYFDLLKNYNDIRPFYKDIVDDLLELQNEKFDKYI